MRQVLVLGDGARAPSASVGEWLTLPLSTLHPDPNIRLQIEVFRTRFLRELPERLDDLLRIAAFVYAADTRVTRGTEYDVFGEKWVRSFRMVLPVWDPAYWSTAAIQELLSGALRYLTGDEYAFEFVRRSTGYPLQGILQFKELVDPLPRVDAVILFSGGTDSLAAAVEALREGHHPILVSHRSSPILDRRQRNLVALLREKFPVWCFPHISMWVNRAGGRRTVEFSQRSRSFLFTSLGAVAACLLEIDDVRLCDNGVVSINLPRSGQNVGTLLSRSTHPRYLVLAQRLMREVTDRRGLNIRNTLLFKTKREVLGLLAESGHPDLLQEAVSCAHVEGKTRLQPHCGVCSQCIDRRFAALAAGLARYDLPARYEKDVFVDALEEGEEQTHAENVARFALSLEALQAPGQLFEVFPDLYDSLPDEGDVDAAATALWDLFQRHQRDVNTVLERQLQEHAADIRRGALPATCLLRIVSSGRHARDPRFRYVERLRSLLCTGLPPCFQTQKARNERQVQDAGEALLKVAEESLQRESPQIPFATVTTKPDFSSTPDNARALFVEFKYVRDRRRLNTVITEMTSRVTIYLDQGAWILFLVYDPNRSIVDDDRFTEAFIRHEGVWVGVAR